MTNQGDFNCWIISSGLIGCENQCIGLAEKLNLDYEIKKINPSMLLSIIAPYGIPRKSDETQAPWPDIVIGAGRRTIPYVRYIKKKSKGSCFTVYLQDPKINTNNFDLVWAPYHDNLKGNNVISTLLSPGRVSNELLRLEKEKWSKELTKLPKPYLTILIGGKSKGFEFSNNERLHILDSISKVIKSGWTPLISTSRRTPKKLIKDIKSLIANKPHYLYDNKGNNPYYAFLEMSDVALVTPDSVNMISETLTANLSTYIFDLNCKSRKINNFLSSLIKKKYIKKFEKNIEIFDVKVINATEQIANHISNTNTHLKSIH